MIDSILCVEYLMMYFGGIKVLNDVNLEVEWGLIIVLIGFNGVGKIMVFNCLIGFYWVMGGSIVLWVWEKVIDVIQVLGQKFYLDDFFYLVQLGRWIYYKMFGGIYLVNCVGLVCIFQNICLFCEMLVIENLLVVQYIQVNCYLLVGIINICGYWQVESQVLDCVFYWLEVVEMVDCVNCLVGIFFYGQQWWLEIVCVMCICLEMICLDELVVGFNLVEIQVLSWIICFLCQQYGIMVLLIEYDMGMVMEILDYIIVFDYGDVIVCGVLQVIQVNVSVIVVYFGVEEEEMC